MRPMARAKGQGTIVPIPPSPAGKKRWRVVVTMADGRRVWRTAHSLREAERVRAQLVEAREVDLDPTRQTVADYLRGWVAAQRRAKVQRVRTSTIDHYALVVETHLVPDLGAVKLSALTGRRIQQWVDDLEYAPSTIRHYHAVLRRALNVAVRQRLLAWNAATAVELPEDDSDAADPLTIDEARALLAATRDDWLGPMWRLALVTGMRRGEMLGLAWDAVGDGWIEVRGQLQRVPPDQGGDRHGWGMVAVKSGRRVERVNVDPDTMAVLDGWKVRQAAARRAEWRYDRLVFVTEAGMPWHGRDLLNAFHRACDAAGIRRRRFHDLRHSSASLLNDEGVDEPTRMARLGHSTTAMARKYAAASDRQDREAVEALGRALGG